MIRVSIYRDDVFQQTVEIAGTVARIGRAAENDVVLKDPDKGVSRFHAELHVEAGQVIVVDLNSQNGVWVGERRVPRENVLPGTVIGIGPYRLVLEDEAAGAAVMEPRAAPAGVQQTGQPSMAQRGTTLPPPVHPPRPKPPAPVRRRPVPWPAVIGGAVLIVALVLAMILHKPEASPQAEPTPAAAPAAATSPVPIVSDDESTVEAAKTEARGELEKGNYDAALEVLGKVPEAKQNDPGVVSLRLEIQTKKTDAEPVASKPEETAPAQKQKNKASAGDSYGLQDWPTDWKWKPQPNPGESAPYFLARANGYRTNYQGLLDARKQKNYQTALGYIDNLKATGAGFPDLDVLKTEVLKDDALARAGDAMADGQTYESQRELGKAVDKFRMAIGHLKGYEQESEHARAKAGEQQLLAKIDAEWPTLTSDFTNAINSKKYGEAQTTYYRMLQVLPTDDPRRRNEVASYAEKIKG